MAPLSLSPEPRTLGPASVAAVGTGRCSQLRPHTGPPGKPRPFP